MIIRIIAVDPEPRAPADDVVVWQVPEHSRACELLTGMLDERGVEWTTLTPSNWSPKKERAHKRRRKGGDR